MAISRVCISITSTNYYLNHDAELQNMDLLQMVHNLAYLWYYWDKCIILHSLIMSVGYVLACRSYYAHYTIPLSSLCKLIWRHRTYEMLLRYILSSVWVRLSIFYPLSIIQYMGLCVFSLTISLEMIERIYILCLIIIITSEVWSITWNTYGAAHWAIS